MALSRSKPPGALCLVSKSPVSTRLASVTIDMEENELCGISSLFIYFPRNVQATIEITLRQKVTRTQISWWIFLVEGKCSFPKVEGRKSFLPSFFLCSPCTQDLAKLGICIPYRNW